jgi:alpha-galactosidase
MLDRRGFLDLGLLFAADAAAGTKGRRAGPPPAPKIDLETLKAAPSRVVPANRTVKVERAWDGARCRIKVVNGGKRAVKVREVVAFSVAHALPPETRLYGESFQMLTQTGGTLGAPVNLGYDEVKHYKMPQPAGTQHAATGLLTLSAPSQDPVVLAWSSCKRFTGRFYLRPGVIEAALDTEGLALGPGESWEMEELFFASGPARAPLLTALGDRINENHPPLRFARPPTGWCSWYCFGPRVTAQQVLDNLDVIAKQVPSLKYVQIDDGYQPAMGDWLETGKAFGGDIQGVLKQIRARGFEPAIWVAPFIAEAGSNLFQQHPDWFIRGADRKPLPSNQVTFGGWRRGPWYALDGTHPAVQAHFESLFKTMRQEWGCTYFKLDANFWGAMHGGRFHDPKATRIEAYRRGMQAILEGTGDGFVLGCNHPIWGSFGLIHGSRSSGDVKRLWATFQKITRQNLSRNWQNGRLWWNDSDAVVLTGELPENEYLFHATAVYASGGMILSGDDLTKIPPARLAILKKLLPPTGTAAAFEDETLRVGWIDQKDTRLLCLFNFGDEPQTLSVKLAQPYRITDHWSGADLGKHQATFELKDMPPRSARLLSCKSIPA